MSKRIFEALTTGGKIGLVMFIIPAIIIDYAWLCVLAVKHIFTGEAGEAVIIATLPYMMAIIGVAIIATIAIVVFKVVAEMSNKMKC